MNGAEQSYREALHAILTACRVARMQHDWEQTCRRIEQRAAEALAGAEQLPLLDAASVDAVVASVATMQATPLPLFAREGRQ